MSAIWLPGGARVIARLQSGPAVLIYRIARLQSGPAVLIYRIARLQSGPAVLIYRIARLQSPAEGCKVNCTLTMPPASNFRWPRPASGQPFRNFLDIKITEFFCPLQVKIALNGKFL